MKWRWLPWLLFFFVITSMGVVLSSERRLVEWLWALPFAAYSAVGALVASREPHNRLGWIYLLSNVFLAVTTVAENALVPASGGPIRAILTILTSVGWIGGLGMMITLAWLFFPDGHLPSPRWRPVLWTALISLALIAVEDAVRASPVLDAALPAGLVRLLSGVATAGILAATLGSAASLLVRYSRSTPVMRQQVKLVVASVLLVSPLALVIFYVAETLPETSLIAFAVDIMLPLIITVVPISTGLAIFKYRLYDIDFVIRKTLSYTLLTAFLALIYFGAVVVLQQLFRVATGQNSSVAIVISTLAVAALFTPLRRRVQTWIDSRFYRRKYDAQKMLEHFGIVARDQVELEELAAELQNVVYESVQPSELLFWFSDRFKLAGRSDVGK